MPRLSALHCRLLLPARCYSHSIRFSSGFSARPSPPKLPADQQAEFERLQRAAAVSMAFQEANDIAAASSSSSSAEQPSAHATDSSSSSISSTSSSAVNTAPPPTHSTASTASTVSGSGSGQDKDKDTINQGLFRGAPPEFTGDKNPKTGEVGGPKNEPLRWGGAGDWSYNGRVTDF